MPKKIANASPLTVKRIDKVGLTFVGHVPGLGLLVSQTGAKSWILRTTVGGRRRDIGLGGFPETTLAMATERARATKEQIRDGIDPIASKKLAQALVVWTFDRCAEEYIKLHRSGWKNAKHAQQWENTLATYASPIIGQKNVAEITVGDVLEIIEPIWITKTETAARLRSRIELVLSWAASRGYRSKENPAAWRGNLEHSLPMRSKVTKVKRHKALPYKDAPEFYKQLSGHVGIGASALKFKMLTATRSNEVHAATWDEIDLVSNVWTIPEGRMKAGKEHRVPLSDESIALLKSLPRFAPPEGKPDYVFPGQGGRMMSIATPLQLMKRMGVDAVPHGLRSTITDWAAEETSFPEEIREAALAHTLSNKVQEAYQRGDLLERRRVYMNAWGQYLTGETSGNVTKLVRKLA